MSEELRQQATIEEIVNSIASKFIDLELQNEK